MLPSSVGYWGYIGVSKFLKMPSILVTVFFLCPFGSIVTKSSLIFFKQSLSINLESSQAQNVMSVCVWAGGKTVLTTDRHTYTLQTRNTRQPPCPWGWFHIIYSVCKRNLGVLKMCARWTWEEGKTWRQGNGHHEGRRLTSPAAVRECWCSSRWLAGQSRRWTGCSRGYPRSRPSSTPSDGGPVGTQSMRPSQTTNQGILPPRFQYSKVYETHFLHKTMQ